MGCTASKDFKLTGSFLLETGEKVVIQQQVLTNGRLVELHEDLIGKYLRYLSFNDGLDPEVMRVYEVNKHNPYKVDRDTWDQLVSFFMYYANKRLEVQARILFRTASRNDGRYNHIVIVPNQVLTGGSVTYDYDYKKIYDLDGNEYSSYQELVELGYSTLVHVHLHPFDMPLPSGIDDINELPDPIFYSIISLPNERKPNQYRVTSSVVANNGEKNVRYHIEPWTLYAIEENTNIWTYEQIEYSPIVHNQIVDKLPAFMPSAPTNKNVWVPYQSWLGTREVDKKLIKKIAKLIDEYGISNVYKALAEASRTPSYTKESFNEDEVVDFYYEY